MVVHWVAGAASISSVQFSGSSAEHSGLQVQARYQQHNPDAARPARRIYVGGLPPDTVDVRPRFCSVLHDGAVMKSRSCWSDGYQCASSRNLHAGSCAFM